MESKRGSRTSLEVFLNLKNKVRKLEKKIRAMLDPKPKHRPVPLHDVSDIADAASLAYHGILGPVRELHLQHVDISSIPTLPSCSFSSGVCKRTSHDMGCQDVGPGPGYFPG